MEIFLIKIHHKLKPVGVRLLKMEFYYRSFQIWLQEKYSSKLEANFRFSWGSIYGLTFEEQDYKNDRKILALKMIKRILFISSFPYWNEISPVNQTKIRKWKSLYQKSLTNVVLFLTYPNCNLWFLFCEWNFLLKLSRKLTTFSYSSCSFNRFKWFHQSLRLLCVAKWKIFLEHRILW